MTATVHYSGHENLAAMSAMSRYNRWIYDTLSPHIGRRVLEAGCGNGNITRFLLADARVENYSGLDLSPAFCESLARTTQPRQGQHVEFQPMDLGSANFSSWAAGREFDSIVCLNVLEHVQDDCHLLRTFSRSLAPESGRLVLQVPAFQSLYGTIDEIDGHYRRYNRGSLEKVVRQAGLTVRKAFYFNMMGIPAWIWHGKILRLQKHPQGELKLWDSMVPLLRGVERVLPLPAGLSVFLVASRDKAGHGS